VRAVQDCIDLQSCFGFCGCDELDNDLITRQWSSFPVDGDKGKESVLDLVPLGGAGKKMADRDGQIGLVGQFLQLDFPQPEPITIATSVIGGNEQAPEGGICLFSIYCHQRRRVATANSAVSWVMPTPMEP